jgi:hypothetical protein
MATTKSTAISSGISAATGALSAAKAGTLTSAQKESAMSALKNAQAQLSAGVQSGEFKSGVNYKQFDPVMQRASEVTGVPVTAQQPVVTPEAIKTPTPQIPVFETGDYWRQAVRPPLQQTEAEEVDQRTQQKMEQFQDMWKEIAPRSTEEEMARTREAQEERQFKQQIADLSGRLGEITSRGQAAQLQVVGQGRGIPEAIIGGQQAQIARETAIEALPVQAQLEAAQGNLQMAQNTLERLFKYKSMDIEREYNYKKDLITGLKAIADEGDKRKLELADRASDRAYNEAQKTNDFISEVTVTAAQNYAPESVLRKMATATTRAEVLAYGAGYMRDPYEKRLKLAQIAKAEADVAEMNRAAKTADMISQLDPTSPTFTLEMMKKSKGGKTLTEGQLNPINKGLTVVNQIGTLSQLLEGTDTGPVLGILRSKNPYDVKAQQIDAQLRALVPNLARGVYGEVGVLTDTDISNYSKTLGNIRSTEQANQLLLSMTLKTIKNSLDNQFEVNAAAGRDVSGFEPIYNRLQGQLNSINASLGISNVSDTAQNYLDSQLKGLDATIPNNAQVKIPSMTSWLNTNYKLPSK